MQNPWLSRKASSTAPFGTSVMAKLRDLWRRKSPLTLACAVCINHAFKQWKPPVTGPGSSMVTLTDASTGCWLGLGIANCSPRRTHICLVLSIICWPIVEDFPAHLGPAIGIHQRDGVDEDSAGIASSERCVRRGIS